MAGTGGRTQGRSGLDLPQRIAQDDVCSSSVRPSWLAFASASGDRAVMGRETGETARCTDHHSGHRLVRGDRRRSSNGRLQFVPWCAEPADATRNVGCAGRFRRPGAHPDYRPQQPIPRRFPGLDCAIRAYAVADGSHAGTTIIPSDHARLAGSALALTPPRNSKADLLAGGVVVVIGRPFYCDARHRPTPTPAILSPVILGLGVSPM